MLELAGVRILMYLLSGVCVIANKPTQPISDVAMGHLCSYYIVLKFMNLYMLTVDRLIFDIAHKYLTTRYKATLTTISTNYGPHDIEGWNPRNLELQAL
jgi:hypothetical protein